MKNKQYIDGKYESVKFAHRREQYYEGLEKIKSLNFDIDDYFHHFPAFVGHMTLSRFLALYEAYKITLGVSGHIAEIGVYKGAGTLFFAKLTQIFEPETLVQVHGFDWFKGTHVTKEEKNVFEGSYKEDYERLLKLISAQGLDNIVRIHKIDLSKELENFFEENNYMQFKLLFFDAGTYDVVSSCIRNFWQRLTPGGVLVLDQFNQELSPGETRAVKELLPDVKIKTFSFGWMPTAYIIKE